jgi:hypothetical protein
MTEQYHTLTVALDHDIRSDDAEWLIKAIGMLRGVLSVTPHPVNPDSWVAEERAKRELTDKLWKVLHSNM